MTRFRLIMSGCCLALGATASAEIIDLGGGWQAELFTDNVELEVVKVGDDALFIEKSATFTEIDEFTGEPVPINIAFMQNADDAGTIVINSESLTNMTGQDWVDFEFILVDGGDATWNADEMSDLSIDPFTSDEFLDGSTTYRTFDGTVADGETWNPGADSGAFVIDVDLSDDDPKVFSLKEAPSIPAPGAVALIALGGVALGHRRRS